MAIVIGSTFTSTDAVILAAETQLPFIWVGIENLQSGKVPFPEGCDKQI